MNTERDKFLTEAMGECWHEWETSDAMPDGWIFKCKKCSKKLRTLDYNEMFPTFPYEGIDFSTWESFGKLLEWCKVYGIEKDDIYLAQPTMSLSFLTPDRFANAVYVYLKNKS